MLWLGLLGTLLLIVAAFHLVDWMTREQVRHERQELVGDQAAHPLPDVHPRSAELSLFERSMLRGEEDGN